MTVLTHYKKRTPAEREMLARTLRNASIGKRKQRRAIKRKLLGKPGSGGAGRNPSGMGLGVSSASGTGACTPDVRSTTGSICGSLYSGGDGPSPTPIPKPRTSREKTKTLMSGVLGERSIPQPQSYSAPPAISSIAKAKSKIKKSKKFVTLDEGEYKVVSFVCDSKAEDETECPSTNNCASEDVGSGEGSMSTGKKPPGGIRVSARVTTCDDENEQARFYLETEMEHAGRHESMATGNLTDAVLNMLGRHMNPGLPSGAAGTSGPGNTQLRDYTAELIGKGHLPFY